MSDEIWIVEHKVKYQDGTNDWWRCPEICTNEDAANAVMKRYSYQECRVRRFVDAAQLRAEQERQEAITEAAREVEKAINRTGVTLRGDAWDKLEALARALEGK